MSCPACRQWPDAQPLVSILDVDFVEVELQRDSGFLEEQGWGAKRPAGGLLLFATDVQSSVENCVARFEPWRDVVCR